MTSLYSELVSKTEEYRTNSNNIEKDYVLFGYLVGRNYQPGGIGVIGRSSNGWDRYNLSSDNLFVGEDRIFNRPEKLTELKENNTRSKFWQVMQEMLSPIYGDDWEQYITYSNYFKIAPDEEAENNGTPPRRLCNLQESACRQILHNELESCRPKHLIVFTGCNLEDMYFSEKAMSALSSFYLKQEYWPEPIYTKKWDNENNWLEVYKMGKTYVYLTEHPDRKSVTEHAKVIAEALNKFFIRQ